MNQDVAESNVNQKRRHGFSFDAEAYEQRRQDYRDKMERQHIAEMDAMPAHFGLCYFIGNVEAGLVKIGFSRKIPNRLSRLRSGSLVPLSVLATINGAEERERHYHHKFAASAIGGEWFEITPEIMAEIEAINGGQNQFGPESASTDPARTTRWEASHG